MTIETIKTPQGKLLSRVNIAIVRHVRNSGTCDLHSIANAMLTAPYSNADLVALRARLRVLSNAHHIHRLVVGDVLHWKAGPGPEEEEEEDAVPAVRNIAPPRRINVMAGRYVPERSPVMRPGADHRHLQSRGHRC